MNTYRKYNITKGINRRLSVHVPPTLKDTLPQLVYQRVNSLHNKYVEEILSSSYCVECARVALNTPDITIEPSLQKEIEAVLSKLQKIAVPLTPPTDYELLAYLEAGGELEAIHDGGGRVSLTVGKKYRYGLRSYKFSEPFKRKKPEYDKAQKKWEVREHECSLNGMGQAISVWDNTGSGFTFLAHPNKRFRDEIHESKLWEWFKKPVVPTVKEVFPDEYNHAMQVMDTHELLAEFNYYPGQKDYIARMACKDFGLPAAETGVGKTLVAISLMIIKGVDRVLVIAPKGTVKGSNQNNTYNIAQWEAEIKRFAPSLPVHHLFSEDDYHNLRDEWGELPKGVFISYPNALFTTGAKEFQGANTSEFRIRYDYGFPQRTSREAPRFSEGVGQTNPQGILCVVKPSLSTIIGNQFDMICLDEAHQMKNINATRTKGLLRMQARYRYAFTATPIANALPDLFSLMGWLAVPDWHLNGRVNTAWPYALGDRRRFVGGFLAKEVDYTASHLYYAKHGKQKLFSSPSHHVSKPTILLRQIKPLIGYINKKMCNPQLPPCTVTEVRVPFGKQQEQLYLHCMEPANLPPTDAVALVQQSFLRNVCSDPYHVSLDLGLPFPGLVSSNFNPKLATILQLVEQCLSRGEQVLIVSARLRQLSEIQRRLDDAKVETMRIDSTTSDHAAQSLKFKSGVARVGLMGIQMAVGHSFDNCPNLIIGSLEWTYSAKQQALGRVWRINSPVPVNVWCVLNENSIEEAMYERVAAKTDTALLCLQGIPVSTMDDAVDPSVVLAEHIINYRSKSGVQCESECERQWPLLKRRLDDAANGFLVA